MLLADAPILTLDPPQVARGGLLRDGRIVSLDEADVLRRARLAATELWQRMQQL